MKKFEIKFDRSKHISPCDLVISDLKGYMAEYTKGEKGVFKKMMEQTDFAIANAVRGCKQAERSGTDNPTTRIHELVDYLRNLKGGQ